MKVELNEKIMKEFCGLKVKINGYLIDDSSEDKKAKCTKKCVIKKTLKFEDYKNSFALQLENQPRQLDLKIK